jgi:3-dehydroquinate synthase
MIPGRFYPVFAGHEIWQDLAAYLDRLAPSQVFLLTDEHVRHHCMAILYDKMPALKESPVFVLPPGEGSKDAWHAEAVWKWLSEYPAGKDALLINLGGGVVSDLGGFVAGTYKRGITFINLPTTLIGQADAAVGGKTGINLEGFKNQVGTISHPGAVFICPAFLKSLPVRALVSGYPEIIKTALVTGAEFWDDLNRVVLEAPEALPSLIRRCVMAKLSVADLDPEDRNERKCLNFGHTIGHALEGVSHSNGNEPLLHGEAVAAGMICEAYISTLLTGLDNRALDKMASLLKIFYDRPVQTRMDMSRFLMFASRDKKNSGGEIRFTLIEAPGKPVIDCPVQNEIIEKALRFYRESYTS